MANSYFQSEISTGPLNTGFSLRLRGLEIDGNTGGPRDGVFILNGGLRANGSMGTSNYVLRTNGTNVYWAPGGTGGGGGQTNVFSRIAVAGQTPLYADAANDILTFAAGYAISLTTDVSTDKLTIAATNVLASNAYVASIYQTKAIERAALANTNAFIKSQLANTNLAITNVKNNLLTTNTALRTLISDRLQVANAAALYTTKSNPTTSGLWGHTGRATISTNLSVSGNTSLGPNLFLPSSGAISWNSGDAVITHSADLLTYTGTDVYINRTSNTAFRVASANAEWRFITNASTSGYRVDCILDDTGVYWNTNSGVRGFRWRMASAGGFGLDTSSNLRPNTSDTGALGTSALMWADLFLASGAVINFNAGDVTATHSTNRLTIGGGDLYNTRTDTFPSIVTNRDQAHGSAAVAGLFGAYGRDSASNSENYGYLYWYVIDDTSTSEDSELRFAIVSAGTVVERLGITGSTLYPLLNDVMSLGTSLNSYSDLFLASGGVINFNAGDVTLTHASGGLTLVTTATGNSPGLAALNLTSSDVGAVGPFIVQHHSSASPAASDYPGGLVVYGKDSAGNNQFYGQLDWMVSDATSTSEDSNFDVYVTTAGSTRLAFTANGAALSPGVNDGEALGTTSLMWSDLYLASGAVINFNNGNLTLTHSAGVLTATGIFYINNGANISPDANASGQFKIAGSGYSGYIALNATAMYIGQNSGSRLTILQCDETNRLTCDTTGAYVSGTRFGIGAAASFPFDCRQSTNETQAYISATHATLTNGLLFLDATRAATSSYPFLLCYSGASTDLEFHLRGDGNAFCDGSWTGGGADYAEYYEWADGNPHSEDRRGYSVVFEGDKIRKALWSDNPMLVFGVVSGNPSVVGDSAFNKWKEKYLRDDFGSYIFEQYSIIEWEEQIEVPNNKNPTIETRSYPTDEIPEGVIPPENAVIRTRDDTGALIMRRVLNPAYDPTVPYVNREDRPEWDCVGLVGKLRLRKGQPVGDRWIKMRDVSDTVEEWQVRG